MIEVSLLRARDVAALFDLWRHVSVREGASCELSVSEFESQVLLHGGEPRAVLAVDPKGWFVARSERKLLGFAHCTVGRLYGDDHETLRGVLRSVMLAPDASPAVIRVLLRAVERYFRTQKDIQSVVAFHPHTGYPVWADGRGAVMHHQWSLMEALGNAGFHLTERWLFFSKVFNALIPEHLPALPGVRLVWDDVGDTDVGMLAFSGQDVVARARFVILPRCNGDFRPDTASLFYLEVCAAYRRQGLGHWLFERGINRLVDRGVYRLLIDVSHQDTLFQSRLRRLGFYEQPQRGYTYIKKL